MLKSELLSGASLMVASRLISKLIDFAILIVLARIIAPAEFGLIAIAVSIVTVFDMLLEVPLSQALVAMREPTDAHYDTAFTLGGLRAAGLTALFIALAAPVASIYGDDRLAPLLVVLGLAPAARSLFSPRMAEHVRAMQFKPIVLTQIGGKLIAAAATLALLWTEAGYWAVVANTLIAAIVTTLLSYVLAPARAAFDLTHWRAFAQLAGWFSLSQIMAALAWQLDRIILGANPDRDQFGQYTMASDLSVLPAQALILPAMQPMMSAMAQAQDEPAKRTQTFLFATQIVLLISMPVTAFFVMVPDWIVRIVVGTHWDKADDYLAGLSAVILPAAYAQAASALAMAMNRMRALFIINAVNLATLLVFLPVGIALQGVEGAVAARAVAAVLWAIILVLFVRRLSGIGLRQHISACWRVFAAGAVLMLTLWPLRTLFEKLTWPLIAELGLMGLAGAALYLGTLQALGGLPHWRDFLKPRAVTDS